MHMHCSNKAHKRRWRSAFAAISFIRALVRFISKKALQRDTAALLRRSLSYVAVDVESPPPSLPGVDPKALADTVRARSLEGFAARFGGVDELVVALESDAGLGIAGADVARQKVVFGANEFRRPPGKSFAGFAADAARDPVVLILLGCAALSLGFGIKQHGIREGWFDGGSIVVAVVLVVAVTAASNFRQSRQFRRLSVECGDVKVEVVRDGRRGAVSIFDIVVGDVVCLKAGDQVPADGVFLSGHSLEVDESSMTGESDRVAIDPDRNPFLLSGTKVADGFGTMLVASVGENTAWGEMMSSVSLELDETTPLQARLEKLTAFIAKIGLSVAAVVLVVMLVRYFTGPEFAGGRAGSDEVGKAVVGIVTAAVAIVVVAIPEGLPLAVTLTLAYSMKRMMRDNALVRKLSACETMGSATVICTDKTGTLTLNEMRVTEVWLASEEEASKVENQDSIVMSPLVVRLLHEAVGLNTAGSVYKPGPMAEAEISGSPTEKAILSWAVFTLGLDVKEVKREFETVKVEAFNSEKKGSGVLIRRHETGAIEAHWKGAAEMVLETCSGFYDRDGNVRAMDDGDRNRAKAGIRNMAAKSLRCIAFAHGGHGDTGLALLSVVGLKDPCRPGARAAVERCAAAGVAVKMITGDNIDTARAIAAECGILSPDDDDSDGVVVEGAEFRGYSAEERSERAERIKVMARSSPQDKLMMVRALKAKGHVVAVTGDGTNDAPALREADVGLSMGGAGTEVAKESSDVVILDDNFASVVTVLRWGRCVRANIQKFIQFQLTVNFAALAVNLVAASASGRAPLTAVQLLWVNLIMDTLAALALAAEPPSDELMAGLPPGAGRSAPLVTAVMWRNLAAQAAYQTAVLLSLQFGGEAVFRAGRRVNDTVTFNTFVLCQVFNEFNARKLEDKNIFRGVHRNKLFLGIIGLTVLLQVLMVEILNRFADTVRLGWGQWAACVGIAAMTWPIGWLVKCVPVSGTRAWLRLAAQENKNEEPEQVQTPE